jgi:nicotinate-nucleotide adenylyltransferase
VKIGVFGGSFDPVHVGHLIVAEAAADALGLDTVLFVPAHTQPFKQGAHAASPEDRVAMLRAAIADNPRFKLDTREVHRGGPSYTSVTLRELTDEYPDHELVLIIGADAAAELSQWHEPDEVARLARLAVLTRPGEHEPMQDYAAVKVIVPAIDISATQVRDMIRSGWSARYLVPHRVHEYIETHGLYAD